MIKWFKDLKKRRQYQSKNCKSNIPWKTIYVLVFVSLICTTYGFAALNTELLISGEAYVRPDYDIRVDGLKFITTGDQGMEKYKFKYTKDSTTIFASLPTQESTITYEIYFKNNTLNDYGIFDITGIQDNLEYVISDYKLTDKLCSNASCNNGNIDKITLTIKYKDGGFDSNKTDYAIDLNYEFRGFNNITYLNFDDKNNYQDKVMIGAPLKVNLGNEVNNVSVKYNNALLINGQGYSFSNGILSMSKLPGNIIVKNRTINGSISTNGVITFVLDNSSTSNDAYGDFEKYATGTIYNGNNGNFSYDENNGLILNSTNPIPTLKIDNNELSDEYSIYMDLNIPLSSNKTSMLSIYAISKADKDYLSWLNVNNNSKLCLASYYRGEAAAVINETAKGHSCISANNYFGKITNIQITSNKLGYTNIYLNGVLVKTFESGGNDTSITSLVLGELRPNRNLKFTGKIYDVAFYNRMLTEEEVQQNWRYAEAKWIID